jgi:hypothetical protein
MFLTKRFSAIFLRRWNLKTKKNYTEPKRYLFYMDVKCDASQGQNTGFGCLITECLRDVCTREMRKLILEKYSLVCGSDSGGLG